MRPRLAYLLLPLTIAGLLAALAQEQKEPAKVAYAKQIVPLLKNYCLGCHSGPKAKAGLSLDKITTDEQAAADRTTWEKVIQVLTAREMPPAKKPQPSAAERDLFLAFLH